MLKETVRKDGRFTIQRSEVVNSRKRREREMDIIREPYNGQFLIFLCRSIILPRTNTQSSHLQWKILQKNMG